MNEISFKNLEKMFEDNNMDFSHAVEHAEYQDNDIKKLLDKENITLNKVYGEREGYDCDEFVLVVKFSKDDIDVFVKIVGWYASHSGSEFDGCEPQEVKPIQKVITDYVVV